MIRIGGFDMSHPSPAGGRGPFISVRSALILTIALLVAAVAGMLTFIGGTSWPGALLAGLGVAGATVSGLDQLLE